MLGVTARDQKAAMRKTLRRYRVALGASLRLKFAEGFATHAPELLEILPRTSVLKMGSYQSMGSEACPLALEAAMRQHTVLHWPRCIDSGLRFSPTTPVPAVLGAFKVAVIPAPVACPAELDACGLDLIIVPLLGFTSKGFRLGQGGGFYDRALSNCGAKPFRLGLGFECQRVSHLPIEPWDQPLHAVLTENGLQVF